MVYNLKNWILLIPCGGQVPPPWPCESREATKWKVSNLRRRSVVAGPAGLGPAAVVGGGPVFWFGGGGGAPHRRARDCLTVMKVWSWAPDGCFVQGRAGRLTVCRNMRPDSSSSCLRGNEYERKKRKHCWGRSFVFVPPGIYASRNSRLALQDVEADSNHLHRSPWVVKGDGKGTQCLGV
jgi:hypothetical protein